MAKKNRVRAFFYLGPIFDAKKNFCQPKKNITYNLRERKKSCPKNLATTPSPPPLQRTKGLSLKLSDVVKVHLIMTFVDMVHNFRIVIRHQDSLFLLLLGPFRISIISFH